MNSLVNMQACGLIDFILHLLISVLIYVNFTLVTES